MNASRFFQDIVEQRRSFGISPGGALNAAKAGLRASPRRSSKPGLVIVYIINNALLLRLVEFAVLDSSLRVERPSRIPQTRLIKRRQQINIGGNKLPQHVKLCP